jgi:hypothetical protein
MKNPANRIGTNINAQATVSSGKHNKNIILK